MLVYGEAQERVDLAEAWRALGQLVRRTTSPLGPGLDPVRVLVVAAGQVEQAAHDALAPDARSDADPRVARAHELTAILGRWLVERLERPSWTPPQADRARVLSLLAASGPGVQGRLKTPEGFAFYGLRPETYARAARRWVAEHGTGYRRALVLGVRSIGTTLAAVVTAALRARGLEVECHTVRPRGDPFERKVGLDGWRLEPGRPVLLVDEGPGLSGSSLAALVRAVHAAGLAPPSVALLPSHDGEPGPMAPDWVREIWRDVPRVLAAPDDVASELGSALEGHGSWMALGAHEAPGPAVPLPCRRFARPWVWLEAGPRRARAKLGGLASVLHGGELVTMADLVASGLDTRARAGLGPPVLGSLGGYVVLAAAGNGEAAACDAPRADAVVSYLRATAGPPLSRGAWGEAVRRATLILEHNGAEVLPASQLRRLLDDPPRFPEEPVAAATDYDLSPYHWVRAPRGGSWKVGGRGAAVWDHTAVGPQPLAWSIASAAVELTAGLGESPRELSWWVAAYAAFRLGLATFCSQSCGPDEASRAGLGVERYARALGGAARAFAR